MRKVKETRKDVSTGKRGMVSWLQEEAGLHFVFMVQVGRKSLSILVIRSVTRVQYVE